MSYEREVARLIRINSEERENPGTVPSNKFTVNFQNVTELQAVNRVVIKNVSIPNVQYNIRPALGLNPVGNIFTYNNGTVRTITVPTGNYDIDSLRAAINASAVAIADGLTVTQNAITKRLVFTSTVPISYLDHDSGNNMARTLGILDDSSPAVLSFTAQGLPNISVHSNLYIVSRALAGSSNMISPTLKQLPVCAVIPVNVNFGDYIHYETQGWTIDDIHYTSFSSGVSLQEIDLAVYDGDANLIDLQGTDWTIVVRAYIAPGVR